MKSPALSDDQAVEIAKLLVELEEEMSKPQDFEWAIEKGREDFCVYKAYYTCTCGVSFRCRGQGNSPLVLHLPLLECTCACTLVDVYTLKCIIFSAHNNVQPTCTYMYILQMYYNFIAVLLTNYFFYTGQLYCLQARPIVTLPPSCFFEGEGGDVATLWDNSNIVES